MRCHEALQDDECRDEAMVWNNCARIAVECVKNPLLQRKLIEGWLFLMNSVRIFLVSSFGIRFSGEIICTDVKLKCLLGE